MTEKKLTPKQERFVAEYLIDLNATQATIRAGYSKKTAESAGHRLLRNVEVAKAIASAKEKRAIKTGVTQERVLLLLDRIMGFDIRQLYNESGGMKGPHELSEEAATVLVGVDVTEEFEGSGEDRVQVGYTKKAKVPDRVAALALAMRHLGMLNDKLDLTATVNGLAERMRAQKQK
jgi:phage terminase small subunit